jgi:hypothetical protein
VLQTVLRKEREERRCKSCAQSTGAEGKSRVREAAGPGCHARVKKTHAVAGHFFFLCKYMKQGRVAVSRQWRRGDRVDGESQQTWLQNDISVCLQMKK